MSRTVIWLPVAMTAFRRLRAIDPDGAKRVAGAVRSLATERHPPDSFSLGGTTYRRLRLGDHRILYEVGETIYVLHVGGLPRR